MYNFPKDFFWGGATSAYQVEGDNRYCDWWEWEKRAGLKEASGKACRHYEFYEQDFMLASQLHQNSHRLSIEWSRIEPQEGEFSEPQMQHYRQVISSLLKYKLTPFVSLHHFTNPVWFAKKGGWHNKDNVKYFLRFIDYAVGALADKVTYWITINEPNVYTYHAYVIGAWPPQARSILKASQVESNLCNAHLKAYRNIHEIYKKRSLAAPQVSIAQNMQAFVACRTALRDKIAVSLRNRWYNFGFLDKLIRAKSLDFIGLNYYSRSLVEVRGWALSNLTLDVCLQNHHALKKNSMGWDIYPEGLYQLLVKMKKYGLPVIITENGVCTDDEALRWDFIYEHLKNIYLAIREGVKVRGYLYWSLLDNFEWDKGFSPHFGLVGIDYNTYKRTIKESAYKFGEVCRTGNLGEGINGDH